MWRIKCWVNGMFISLSETFDKRNEQTLKYLRNTIHGQAETIRKLQTEKKGLLRGDVP